MLLCRGCLKTGNAKIVKQRKKNIRKKRDGKGFKESSKEDKNLIRFAHNWNGGILEYWKNGFWETGRLGEWRNRLDDKNKMDNIL